MGNSFWVYVNEPNNKVLIHLGSCSHRNDGTGRGEDVLDNGEWFGYYEREGAVRKAARSGKKNRRWCGFCAKTLKIKTDFEAQNKNTDSDWGMS